jgi:branched-chain amino acid transport system substrate-binding protein
MRNFIRNFHYGHLHKTRPCFFIFKTFLACFLIFISVFTFFSLTSCDSREKFIKIGNQGALTGEESFYGLDQTLSIKLAASELSPVRIGGFDYKIEIINKDDGGNAEKAFLVAQEFVEEGVSAVIGSTFNGTTRASLQVLSEYNIPLITASAQGEDIATGSTGFFRMVINNNQRIENIARFFSESVKPSRLVLVDNGDEYSVKLVDRLMEIFNNERTEFGKRYSVAYDQKEYEVLAENLLIDNPDYIFFCGDYTSLGSIITGVRKIGLNCGFVTEEMGMNDGITSIADSSYLEGLLAIVSSPPSLSKYTEDKKAIEFWRKYGDYLAKTSDKNLKTGLYDKGPGPYAPYAYDALNISIAAMKKANSILSEDFMEMLKGTTYDGVTGNIVFNSNGDRSDPQSTVFVIKNGEWVRYN